jgi:predicted peroxiredoxin
MGRGRARDPDWTEGEREGMSEKKKVGFVVTHAEDDPELATIPFMLANGAMAMGVDPVMIFQGEGVRLAVKGYAETVAVEGLAPLEDLLAAVLGAGHRIMVCSPCLDLRGIVQDDLREGTYIGAAGIVVTAMLECENMLAY